MTSVILDGSMYIVTSKTSHVVSGTDLEAEGHDRADMSLPKGQITLLQDTIKYSMFMFVLLLII